jgi:hypothetical protein
MTELDKLKIDNATQKGYFLGLLKGILWWEIPEELKERINKEIKELENSK